MRLTSLMLADHAEAVRGKLYLTGGAWDTIHVDKFPVIHPHMSVVVTLEVGWDDHDRTVPVEVKLLDADGRSMLGKSVGGQARARRMPGASPGDTSPLLLVFNLFGARFEQAGSYTITVELNGEPSGQIPLKLRQRPQIGSPGAQPRDPDQNG